MAMYPRKLELGRLTLRVPLNASLVELEASVAGLELEELDLGDPSPNGGLLGWLQVSEELREASDFDEAEPDAHGWVARAKGSSGEALAVVQRDDRALVLRGSLEQWPDALARIHALRPHYQLPAASSAPAFALRYGRLELAAQPPEELAARIETPAWQADLATAHLAVTAMSDFEDLADSLRASSAEYRPAFLRTQPRRCGSLEGEEIFMEVPGQTPASFRAAWRFPGVPDDPELPEVELHVGLDGLERSDALEQWDTLLAGLRLAGEAV